MNSELEEFERAMRPGWLSAIALILLALCKIALKMTIEAAAWFVLGGLIFGALGWLFGADNPRHPRERRRRGAVHHNAKVGDATVALAVFLYSQGNTLRTVAKWLGASTTSVSNWRKGQMRSQHLWKPWASGNAFEADR